MELDAEPRFCVGDKVRVVNINPLGHTRAPRYARGKTGTIAFDHGGHTFPDRNAECVREGQRLYSVSFAGSELWGGTEKRDSVRIDLWEPHLEPV